MLISPDNQKRALEINLRVFFERVGLSIDAEMRAGHADIFPGVAVGSSGEELLLLVVVEHDKQQGKCEEEDSVVGIHYNRGIAVESLLPELAFFNRKGESSIL